MAAQITSPVIATAVNTVASIDGAGQAYTAARVALGTIAQGVDDLGNSAEFIYLKGVASTIAGSVVTYNRLDNTTTLLVADACGPVAVAMSANNLSTTFGWYCIKGYVLADVVANSAAAAAGQPGIGRETTNGKVGDGRAAGDEINNCFQRVATTVAALAYIEIDHPFVNNFTGA